MQKQKILTTIFTVIFITVFSIFNFWEYRDFHENKSTINQIEETSLQKARNFELENIKQIENISFFHTPNKDLLTNIVDKINNAETEIYLETYILTEKRIQEALIKAYKKWVFIQIVLEKDPYLAYNINNKAYNKLQKAWIDIVRSNKDNYSFNHSKILLIDNLSIISTGNFSYSTFTKNRDFFVFSKEKKIYEKLKQNFLNDYNWKKINLYDDNLIFSPTTSRIKFEKLFYWAQNNIKMYFQYLKDDELVSKLIKIKQEKNIEISIVIAETAKNDDNIQLLKNAWINIKVLEKNKMHAKAILVDEKYLFIWSINFSNYSLDKNRETWILIKNTQIIKDFLEVFNNDF